MAPWSIFIILISYYLVISFAFILLCIFITKIPKKNIIISIRSHSCKWSYRDWQPLFALVVRIYLFCAGTRDSRVASYWIDTLVLKNWGKYLRYLAASSLPLRGKPTQCSRGSKKDFWRRCRGGLRKSQHTKYPSHTLISHITLFAICLSFFLSPTSPLPFYSPSLSLSSLSFSICLFLPACFLFSCVLVCLLVTMDLPKFTLKG